jgi:predicted enzyme related to lactoylglutathione lyase
MLVADPNRGDLTMLANVPVCATLPTTDLDRAKRFYGDVLGLTESAVGADGGVFFEAGGGTMVRIYGRPPGYTPAEHTVVGFLVEDLAGEISELRRRGVSFEEYDLPDLKTEDGVFTDPRRGVRGSWVKDPDGNIIALTQLPKV